MDPKHSIGPDRIDYKEAPGDLTDAHHAALDRENPEPTARVTPIPLWLTGLCFLVIAWAGLYLGLFHAGFRGDVFNERATSPNQIFTDPYANVVGPAALSPEELMLAAGKKQFTICAGCHQANGKGVPGQFPPLESSEFVGGPPDRLAAIIMKGVFGPITVNGGSFLSAMPPQEAAMDDKAIASVATFVRSSFNNNAPAVSPEEVAKVRARFKDHAMPWTEPELRAWKSE